MNVEQLDAADKRIPLADYSRMADFAARELGSLDWLVEGWANDPAAVQAGDFGLVEYIVRAGPTVADSLAAGERYGLLSASDDELCAFDARSLTVDIVAPERSKAALRLDVQAWLVALLVMVPDACDQPWSPLAVDLPFSRPADRTAYVKLLGGEPRFDAERLRLVFPEYVLRLPVKGDSRLAALLRRHSDEMLRRVPDSDDLVDRLRRALSAELMGRPPSLHEVARRLATSERTLQRRLSARGMSYSEVVDGVRHELACRYLAERDSTIEEISMMLGFSTARGFRVAFRRWRDQSPSDYRRTID